MALEEKILERSKWILMFDHVWLNFIVQEINFIDGAFVLDVDEIYKYIDIGICF